MDYLLKQYNWYLNSEDSDFKLMTSLTHIKTDFESGDNPLPHFACLPTFNALINIDFHTLSLPSSRVMCGITIPIGVTHINSSSYCITTHDYEDAGWKVSLIAPYFWSHLFAPLIYNLARCQWRNTARSQILSMALLLSCFLLCGKMKWDRQHDDDQTIPMFKLSY